ncbi:type I-F CRISPR-associated protein Csy2 [Agaribacter flavus]|uniref:Type I-F CRISPR-associated protein Csy2 n=1 Tax=Agaribacter flavus TaxID=1902781 RepID=A0ABV7FT03_9ALTE
MSIKKLLIIPHLKVQNANALSSPFTIGFPAMTAWLGAVHALQRKLNQQQLPVNFIAVGVVSHDMDLQTYKGENDFVHSIVGTGNPLDKAGARSPFIEEARCHVDVSLVIEYYGLTLDDKDELSVKTAQALHANMKIAGGDILSFQTPFRKTCDDTNDEDRRQISRLLMPGYVLIERSDLMIDSMNDGNDALAALIDHLSIHYSCESDDDGNANWSRGRKEHKGKTNGWIVPIATGFQGISELGQAKNQRDPNTPHRFAESVVTLGEFKMPHRLQSIDAMLWRYAIEGDLYLCRQRIHQMPLMSEAEDESIDSEFN